MVLAQAEQPRLGVAGLGPQRNGAQLQETETEAGQDAGGLAVLIEPGGKAHGVAELYAGHGNGQVLGARQQAHHGARQGHALRGAGPADHGVMHDFRVKVKKKPADKLPV